MLLIAAFFGANSVAFVFLSWMPKYLHGPVQHEPGHGRVQLHVLFADGEHCRFDLRRMARRSGEDVPAGGANLEPGLRRASWAFPSFICRECRWKRWPLLIFLTFFGFAEGIYDANIWASMYDVVHPSRRATMLGLANMIGWLGASVATVGTGMVITRLHMTYGQVLSATAGIYAVVAVLLIVAGGVFAPRDIRHAQADLVPAE